jgi:hypothetical protein
VWNTYIFWNGQWALLDSTTAPNLPYVGDQYYEMVSTNGTHASQPELSFRFSGVHLRREEPNGRPWVDVGTVTQEAPPYCPQWITSYEDWFVFLC